MRRLTAVLMSTLILAGSLTEAVAQSRTVDLTRQYPGEEFTQYRRGYREGYREYRYERPYYGRPHYERRYVRRDRGSDVALGVGALALGVLAAGAIASQAQAQPALPRPPATVDPQLAAHCARTYRSFDARTGTYVSWDGRRLVCTW